MNMEEELRKATEQLNRGENLPTRTNGSQPSLTMQPRYDFVRLGEKIGQGMIMAAEERVAEAAKALEQAKTEATEIAKAIVAAAEDRVAEAQDALDKARTLAGDLRERIESKDREIASLTDRLKAFGESVWDAHHRFKGEQDADATETPGQP